MVIKIYNPIHYWCRARLVLVFFRKISDIQMTAFVYFLPIFKVEIEGISVL